MFAGPVVGRSLKNAWMKLRTNYKIGGFKESFLIMKVYEGEDFKCNIVTGKDINNIRIFRWYNCLI
jgi:hypothetical protein